VDFYRINLVRSNFKKHFGMVKYYQNDIFTPCVLYEINVREVYIEDRPATVLSIPDASPVTDD